MSDVSKPNLTLEAPPGRLKARDGSGLVKGLLFLVVVLQGAVLAKVLMPDEGLGAASGSPGATADPQTARAYASVLEEKGLSKEAALEWERYLDSHPEDEDSVAIAYRAGKLRMDARDYGAAAANFVRAEQIAKARGVEAPKNLGLKIVESLRRLGLYGHVGRELARRADHDQGASGAEDPVLATYAGESITESDLDRMIEQYVDEMMQMEGRQDPRMREAMLRQIDNPNTRGEMLQQFLSTELLARRSREIGLDQEDDFQESLRSMEVRLLASKMLDREFRVIEPTESDIRGYYELNREDYRGPEKASVLVARLKPEDDPQEMLRGVKGSAEFEELAKSRPPEDGQIEREIAVGAPDPLLGSFGRDVEMMELGTWTEAPVVVGEERYLVFLANLVQGDVLPLEQVVEQVQGAYVAQKRQEVSEKLTRDLMERYEVKIRNPSAHAPEEGR